MINIQSIIKCKLPSQMSFQLEGKTLHIKLTSKGLTENMQNDSAAFEGWAMCLKVHYPQLISDVVIEWEVLNKDLLKLKERGHYYRFLYRAHKFQSNYPNWVSVSPAIPAEEIDEIPEWVLNYPHQDSCESQKVNKNAESHLERELLLLMQGHFDVADHQLPVGLFHKSVSKKKENARTSCGLSQIDLWSLDNNILTIYELKNNVNTSVGIISEVQFYANVLKDLTEHKVNYPDDFFRRRKYYRHTKELSDAIYPECRIKKVTGVLLADNRHPLVTDDVVALMSQNKSGIEFSAKTVNKFKEELSK